jgi:hypothetical protein
MNTMHFKARSVRGDGVSTRLASFLVILIFMTNFSSPANAQAQLLLPLVEGLTTRGAVEGAARVVGEVELRAALGAETRAIVGTQERAAVGAEWRAMIGTETRASVSAEISSVEDLSPIPKPTVTKSVTVTNTLTVAPQIQLTITTFQLPYSTDGTTVGGPYGFQLPYSTDNGLSANYGYQLPYSSQ